MKKNEYDELVDHLSCLTGGLRSARKADVQDNLAKMHLNPLGSPKYWYKY